MADITLQSLSDLLAITQSQVDSLITELNGVTNRLGDTETDIANLQNPPPAVPPGLLAWLGVPHTITEVDPTLNTTLTTLDATVSGHTTSISGLTTDLSDEVTDRTNADTTLQTNIDGLQSQVTDNLATLTQEITDRSTLAGSVSTQYDTLNSRIDAVEADLATLDAETSTDTTSLDSKVTTINTALQTIQTQILQLQNIGVDPLGAQASQITALTIIANDAATAVAAETSSRAASDTSLQNSITALSASVSGINSGLNAETSARQAADTTLTSDIATINTTLSGHTGLISSETAARIAADSTINSTLATHATNIADNATAISDETSSRITADTGLQTQITTNAGNISTNTSNISSLTTTQNLIKVKFGVVKDGSGYVTSWRVLDDSAAAGNFNLRNLNNDARLQNPGYVGKYFPPVAVASFAPATTYDTQYGTGPSTNFRGTDANDYSRNVNVYSTLSVGINGSVFMGVDYSSGGNLNRLGQVLTTFIVNFSGYVNGQLSLWYRIKTAPGDNTQRWFPVAMAQISMPSPRTYELASSKAVVQISVTANQVVEFGLTNLTTLDASRSASNTVIYNGAVSVEALNMVTVS